MRHSWLSRNFSAVVMIAALSAFGCSPADSDRTADTGEPDVTSVTVEETAVYGDGNFILADPSVGLSDLSSYQATLTVSFAGTRAGSPEEWSKTYEMVTTRQPEMRQLTLAATGPGADPGPTLLLELSGVEDERHGDGGCTSTPITPGASLADRFEPAGLLNFVIGGDHAGTETVNGMDSDRYAFDQTALGEQGLTEAVGSVWIAADGGYVVKYLLERQAKADYFGEGTEGTLLTDYELTNVNQAGPIYVPPDCPLGLVTAPQLPDATNVLNLGGILVYDSSESLAGALAFYEDEMPKAGWAPSGGPITTEINALLTFSRGNESATVTLESDEGMTKVEIRMGPATQ